MKHMAISHVTRRWFMQTVSSFCMLAFLLTAMPCLPATSQEPDKPEAAQPQYLSTMKTLPGPEVKTGTATILTKTYLHSISFAGYRNEVSEISYSLPGEFTGFKAWVGIDDALADNSAEIDVTVYGRYADGSKKMLTTKTLTYGSKPQEINVDVSNVKILVLQLKPNAINQGALLRGSVWWGGAQLSNEVGNVLQPEPPSGPLKELAAKLTNGFEGKGLLLNHFVLDPDGFDETLAQTVREGLKTELSKTSSLNVNPISKSITDTVKPGDDLPEKTCAALRNEYENFYIVIGRISDSEKERVITASIYDLRTGKSIKNARVSIPKEIPKVQVTLLFTPHPNLRISNFQWYVNDEPNGPRRLTAERRAGSETVDVQPGKHKFKLVWSGDGYPNKDKNDYLTVTVEDFEVEVQKSMTMELSANVKSAGGFITGPNVRGSLDLTVRANGRSFHPKWH